MRFVKSLRLLSISETVAAVNRTVGAGLEGNLALLAALGANGVKHLTLAALAGSVLSCHTAISAALGLVGETFFSVKLLLSGSESEFLSAILADQGLVFVHLVPLINLLLPKRFYLTGSMNMIHYFLTFVNSALKMFSQIFNR